MLKRKQVFPILLLGIIIITASFRQVLDFSSGLDEPVPVGKFLNNTLPTYSASGDLQAERVFANIAFNSPIIFEPHPRENKIVVAQRNGEIYAFDNEPNVDKKSLFLDLSEKVGIVQDGGFLGFVFHPDFGLDNNEQGRYVYTYYATRDSLGGHQPNEPIAPTCAGEKTWYGGHLILSRWEVYEDQFVVNPESELIMVKFRLHNSVHRGGGLSFGNDGFLYWSTGDQGRYATAQRMSDNFNAGVFRLDVDMNEQRSHSAKKTLPLEFVDEISGVGYFIPNDNPFNNQDNIFEEYFSLGLRNPYRLSFDRQTGNMYVGDIGSWLHEEINLVTAGFNGGWPVWEGDSAKNRCIEELLSGSPHVPPLTSFPRAEANAIIGGYVYRGADIPQLYGKYICADYGTGGEIFSVNTQSGAYEQISIASQFRVISFGQDLDGELYILREGNNMPLYRLNVAEPGPDPPATLSEIDAFSNLKALTPQPYLIPYELNVPFWSDGAEKSRWMVIPNDGKHDTEDEKIQFSEEDNWEFPVGSVLIKHFEFGEKKLETRFLVHGEDSVWYGLTYKWRENGEDADLLTEGLDESMLVNGATQIWHYPSQAECQACHNPSTGSTLGPNTRQLNREQYYPHSGQTGNQLATLNHLNILSPSMDVGAIPTFLTSTPSNDLNAPLEDRARAYLDANCAYCHQPGTGNRAGFDFRLSTELEDQGIVYGDLLDDLGIEGAKGMVPKDLEKSMLYHRMNLIEPGKGMPPLAKNKVDEAGLKLIADWIQSLGESERYFSKITLFPNPVSNQEVITLRVRSAVQDQAVLSIFNQEGRKVFSEPIELSGLKSEFNIPLGSLKAGVYVVRLMYREEQVVKRMVVF